MASNIQIVGAQDEHTNWDTVIGAEKSPFDLKLGEIWRYRDLLMLFVKKDIITVYKQTILGPIWFLVQPILTTLIYSIIFGQMAGISTDGIPGPIFYLGSLTLWNYFADTLNLTSKTFSENASVFGKVYFPRMILPLSKVISGLIKLLIQFGLFFVVWLYYTFIEKKIHPNIYVLFFPIAVLGTSLLSLGFGILITSLTTKYRDLTFLISFGVQLMMYATPVIWPLSVASGRKQFWAWLNPLTSLFEAFKYGFLGKGIFNPFWICYSFAFIFVLLLVGVFTFNRVEKKFIDTV